MREARALAFRYSLASNSFASASASAGGQQRPAGKIQKRKESLAAFCGGRSGCPCLKACREITKSRKRNTCSALNGSAYLLAKRPLLFCKAFLRLVAPMRSSLLASASQNRRFANSYASGTSSGCSPRQARL